MLAASEGLRPFSALALTKKLEAIVLMLLSAACATPSRPVALSMFACHAAACVTCGRRSSETFAPVPSPA